MSSTSEKAAAFDLLPEELGDFTDFLQRARA
jgi:hypothetical protein